VKKLITIFIAIILCTCLLAGCADRGVKVSDTTSSNYAKIEDATSMFVVVENAYSYGWKVVYHRDTKVMYTVSNGGYNSGNFTLLVNADGTPMLWED
jgi:hypothetical protein